jgi:NAD(P)-dependent dehydrogenase (short-subunit alcohol dehydrogenase family)
VLGRWGRVDILINAAGGNVPAATLAPGASLWELPEAAFREVFDLNLLGTVLPTQVFGAAMAEGAAPDSSGSIVNISSATAARAVSRVVGYSSAKGAVENFTRWLGVELARQHGDRLRVNAIAPGWFIAEQNQEVMLEPDGNPTPRGRTVIAHTPAGRFGEPEELVGTVIWLCGPGARFVNGAVIPVDGGFGAWTGV